jgi:transcriptional regulator with XRE-family HTH domain
MRYTGNKSEQTAKQVLRLLEAGQLSQRWLSRETGINLATLNRRIQGKSDFTLIELEHVAKAFDISLSDLIFSNEAAA